MEKEKTFLLAAISFKSKTCTWYSFVSIRNNTLLANTQHTIQFSLIIKQSLWIMETVIADIRIIKN